MSVANDGKLYVIITDKTGGGSPDSPNPNGNDTDKNRDSAIAEYAKHQFLHLLKSTATKSVNFGVSQIGNLTGDYALQNDVQNTVNTINGLVSIGMSAYAGLKLTGSPIGAAIGAGISIASQVIDYGISIATQSINTMKQNYQIDMLRQRAGLDGLTNGSRTGN